MKNKTTDIIPPDSVLYFPENTIKIKKFIVLIFYCNAKN